ncbi:glycoside hydrolase family 125 protein [Dothidotthia symphoricarpi CBS 119687]|uniref:Glycoside hydrolase family 125 protein n=1 Tax=Dothidotthia symphoricarpi CBS 119687 TaxID=1392245 RepID=A0A6A5ZYE6_9PLEO|nr:glycoside hydrolase family 125 protein [Dothidotthia symphoricarpi CBS 119687]KAF2124772.1 glycoside hydrolase family 125 protein [Dothidotthia symphoricarpi CBS 119687]
MYFASLLSKTVALPLLVSAQCPEYIDYANEVHEPLSSGRYKLASQRPSEECQTFKSQGLEDTLIRMEGVIKDPDMYRLFQNAYPNTLDTAIKWKGYAADNAEEELTFIITGDINAMWLRDSSNQLQSYLPLLNASSDPNSIASLYRGVINLQARYLLTSPYCNSFQPPVESGIEPAPNEAASEDTVFPTYSNSSVFECKYELDSLGAFLQISADYYRATGDYEFFGKFQWASAVEAVLKVSQDMMRPTYGSEGEVLQSPYTFARLTSRATETFANDGLGNPVANGTGLIRSGFRPSDDATIFQFYVPANMMFSTYLASTSEIMGKLSTENSASLAQRMSDLSDSLRNAIETHGTVIHPTYGKIYAFELDGFGSTTIMDDANIPSLLSAPFLGYPVNDETYANTRSLILSAANSYFMRGPVINAIGGPHLGPGMAWPMASIMRILTSDNDDEIKNELRQVVSSTDGLGLIHESVNSFNQSDWTRQWFSWANGLFGQMILDLEERKPEILETSFQ